MKRSDIHFSHPDSYYSQSNQGNHITSIPIGSKFWSITPIPPLPHLHFLGLWLLAEHPVIIVLKEIPKGASSLSPNIILSLACHWAILSPTSFSLITSVNFCPVPPTPPRPRLQIRALQMYICGEGNICLYGKPPALFDSYQLRSVMFAWHVQCDEENTQTS